MKKYKLIYILISAIVFFVSCKKESPGHSVPIIESLDISQTESILLDNEIYIDAKLSDKETPLSTLEVELFANGEIINSRSIRTKGNDVALEKEALFIPFAPNITTGQELAIRFTLINVDGNEVVVEKTFKAIRPDLPESLYFILSDDVIEFKRTAENPYIYITEEGQYKSSYKGILATDEDIENADFIWNGSGKANEVLIGERFGDDITISYPTWLVSRLEFNALSFKFGVEGEEIVLSVKNRQMTGVDGYFFAEINFVKDEEFEIVGLEEEKLKNAYNRDFFEYNKENGKFKFLRATGNWAVFYSSDMNYFWVMHMEDAAPACYWIVGHGFSCAPVWNAGYYYYGGWDFIVDRLGYAVPIGDGKYQVSMYINDDHEWDSFEFEIYSNLEWEKTLGIELTNDNIFGDKTGIEVSGSNGLTGNGDFVPGYYRLVFDTSGGTGLGKTIVTITRLSD